jgi:hypothetical protein
MNALETQMVDATARNVLPSRFAEARVVLEDISETEVRIRKANGSSEAQEKFPEEKNTILSDRDRDLFLELLANPPAPTNALRNLFAEHRNQDKSLSH